MPVAELRLTNSLVPVVVLLLTLCFLSSAVATAADGNALMQDALAKHAPGELFPLADRIAAPAGEPPVSSVYRNYEQIGLLFLNSKVVNAVGYSGKPIHVLVGLDNNAVIQSLRLLEHHEPIVLKGISEARIRSLINNYIGTELIEIAGTANKEQRFDAISGATVTVRVIDDSILRAGIKVARHYGLAGLTAEAAGGDVPLWQQLWREKIVETAILLVAVTVLTGIFFFQNWVTKQPGLTPRIRIAFMLFTLFFIGFYANAQLSVVNILTAFNALVSGFNWEYFLMEPLVFVIWGAVFAGLLFWGRGAYCGWLCPFGALQELINGVAKWFKLPQLALPWGLHERLWPLKYIIFLGLFGVSLHSLATGERLAEIEPFKTAIILKFLREWPYVMFAIAVLLPGLFIERFYCRYLCPLGAALALPARMRMFVWLKRYRRCGECRVCYNECMVQAIHPEGEINPNECLYCLHCQERYHDDRACPVGVEKRETAERRALIASDQA